MRTRIVRALMRLYPRVWLEEYGAELADMLLARPLTARVIGDVVWNGWRQRVGSADPAARVGFVMLLVTLGAFAWNVAAPPPYSEASNAELPALYERVQILQQPLQSEVYVLVLVALGCWGTLRRGNSPAQSGAAAMKASFIAGVPLIVVAVLMLTGVLHVTVLGPGDLPTTFDDHGFTLTYYQTRDDLPAPYALLVSPLFRLPGSWLWGAIGGLIGRGIAQSRYRETAH